MSYYILFSSRSQISQFVYMLQQTTIFVNEIYTKQTQRTEQLGCEHLNSHLVSSAISHYIFILLFFVFIYTKQTQRTEQLRCEHLNSHLVSSAISHYIFILLFFVFFLLFKLFVTTICISALHSKHI